MTPPGKMTLLIDCRDLDKWIEGQLGRSWNTLDAEQDNELSNGKITTYEAFANAEDTRLVEDWLDGLDIAHTSAILCYLVAQGKLDEGNYTVHLWW